MAVTKIWDVKSHLRELIKYVEDTEKTSINISDDTISTLLEYGVDSLKTEQRLYVTPINCKIENAADIMIKLNKKSRSKSDTIAYHGYQSFARGEVDAKTAHEIGVKLAEELWGKDFPVIVATHINTGTYHNHFAFPATSFSGMRYNDCNTSYRKMREISDRICREYGLSVIEKPRNKSRHIGEIKAEEAGESLNTFLSFQECIREIEKPFQIHCNKYNALSFHQYPVLSVLAPSFCPLVPL